MAAVRTNEPVVRRISGPIVTADGMEGAQMYEVVQVGSLGLVGEVVRLVGDRATIQVYEDTTMLKPGAPVKCTGAPLTVWLGPGLVGNIYDGIQRPLPGIQARSGAWIRRGEKVDPLDTARLWAFEPSVRSGESVIAGQAIGKVEETPLVTHRIMVPPEISGVVLSIVGKYKQALALGTMDHALRQNMYIGNHACFHRSRGLTIPAKLHASNRAAAHTRSQRPKVIS